MVKHLTLWNIPIKLGQKKRGVEMAYTYFYERHLFLNLQSKYKIKFNDYLVKDLNKNLSFNQNRHHASLYRWWKNLRKP